jgi:phosphohistidine swiveling domain-containing protein
MRGEDVYAFATDPRVWWSTSNLGEAAPGVQTPLSWSFWGPTVERGSRRAYRNLGVLREDETGLPPQSERFLGIFYGRVAIRVDFLGLIGDRLPGTSGAEVVGQVLGRLPEDFVSRPTRAQYLDILRRLPRAFATSPKMMRMRAAEVEAWWQQEVRRAPSVDLAGARRQWGEAMATFEDVMARHVTTLFSVVQPFNDQVGLLATAAGDQSLAGRLLAGQGSHAELAVVEDLWRLSRAQIGLDRFLMLHGYHGPGEGELSSHVWREDPEPVHALVRHYAARAETEAPEVLAAERAADRRRAAAELLTALPRSKRAGARLVLRLADRGLPLRGVGKVAFLQSLDVARLAARRIGSFLAEADVIADPEDVFFLSADELVTDHRDLAQVVNERRVQREPWLEYVIPGAWQGTPDVTIPDADDGERVGLVLSGVTGCSGVVEGPVRVLLEPTFEDVEPGEVLVAPFTDPSWASVMFMSSGLVVDIGGWMSHAAVVARELGVPCVMGTGDGTRRLRTGDVCRVDGAAGTVEVLRPVAVA